MKNLRRVLSVFGLTVTLVLAGCNNSGPPIIPDVGTGENVDPDAGAPPDLGEADAAPVVEPDTIAPVEDTYNLVIVGWQQFNLQQGQQVILQVRYSKNGGSEAGETVTFSFKGDSKDSTLNSYSVLTAATGLAEVTLTAGQIIGTYQIEATTPRTSAVSWDIEVQEKPDVTPKVPLLTGTFELASQFDVQGSFEGSNFATALNVINDLSDDPDDPGKFVVDSILDELAKEVNNQVLTTMADVLKPTLYVEVNKILTQIAPKLVADLKQISADLSALARKFQTTSHMVSATPQEADKIMTVDHSLEKIGWMLHGKSVEYSFAQLAQPTPTVKGVELTPNSANISEVAIGEHTFTFKFGTFILVALNDLVIPYVNSNASSLDDLLGAFVNCTDVGTTINDTVGIGGVAIWTSACTMAMKAATAYIEAEIVNIDLDDTYLLIAGQAKFGDENADGFYDQMTDGLWTGTLQINQAITVISGPTNNFGGKRIK
jgi:hypothetical protein